MKAFNTTFAGTLVAARRRAEHHGSHAGDDADAKSSIPGIVTSGGLKAVDAGSLKHAREREASASCSNVAAKREDLLN